MALIVALGAVGSCESPSGFGGDCSAALEPDAEQLLVDASGERLALAVSEYIPSDDELKLAAAYWALLAVGFQDDSLNPAFYEARLDVQVATIMTHYPSFVSCPKGSEPEASAPTQPLTLPLAMPPAACVCGESCLPKATDVASLLVDVGDIGLEIFSKSAAAKPIIAKLRYFADDVVTKVDAARDLKKTLTTYDATKAITDGISKESALSVLQGVDEFIVVAGTIAAAATAAGASAPPLAVIAAVGAVVEAGIMGVKIGTRMNQMMEGYDACVACQAKTCKTEVPGCDPPCASDEVCLNDACTPKTSATTCALRVPSCCPGHDDSCTPPSAACYCDAFCVEAKDCCPDACSVCGYC